MEWGFPPSIFCMTRSKQDNNYDYTLMARNNMRADKSPIIPLKRLSQFVRAVLKPFPITRQKATWALQNRYFHEYGVPIDQTARQTLAQIQVIAKKRSPAT